MSATILVVEDDERSMRLMQRVLAMDGHATACARTGAQAMQLMLAQPPDLVLMDIQLPDATGLALLVWMKGRPALAALPVIAMTASVMPAESGKVEAAGFDAVFRKPLESVEEFQQMVLSLLSRPAP